MILSKDQNLKLELDIHKLSRNDLKWIGRRCTTEVVNELIEKIIEYNKEQGYRKQNIITKLHLPPLIQIDPPPKIMKKVSRLRLSSIFNC